MYAHKSTLMVRAKSLLTYKTYLNRCACKIAMVYIIGIDMKFLCYLFILLGAFPCEMSEVRTESEMSL